MAVHQAWVLMMLGLVVGIGIGVAIGWLKWGRKLQEAEDAIHHFMD